MKDNLLLFFKSWKTVPNIISFIRLLLIPCFCYLYLSSYHIASLVILIISAITDLVDGKIARRFNQVSDLGKVLDPVADKLTQGAVMFCLCYRYELMKIALVVLITKEIVLSITAILETKATNRVNSALWYGKACTVIVYVIMGLLLILSSMSEMTANILIFIAIISMVFTTLLYVHHRLKIIIKIS